MLLERISILSTEARIRTDSSVLELEFARGVLLLVSEKSITGFCWLDFIEADPRLVSWVHSMAIFVPRFRVAACILDHLSRHSFLSWDVALGRILIGRDTTDSCDFHFKRALTLIVFKCRDQIFALFQLPFTYQHCLSNTPEPHTHLRLLETEFAQGRFAIANMAETLDEPHIFVSFDQVLIADSTCIFAINHHLN